MTVHAVANHPSDDEAPGGVPGQRKSRRARWLALALITTAGLTAVATAEPALVRTTVLRADLTVARRPGGRVPPSFVGLSVETSTFARAAGVGGIGDPLLARLVAPLSAHGPAQIRIGGNSGDQTVAQPALRRTLGVRYVLTPDWMRSLARTLRAGHARAQLGLDFALQRPGVAAAEIALAQRFLGPRLLTSVALGNEPDFYRHDNWAVRPGGRRIQARGRGWTFARFNAEYARVVATLPAAGPAPAGPDLGGSSWSGQLNRFVHANPRVRTLNVHAYALTACGGRRAPQPTTAALLDPARLDGFMRRLQPALAAGARARLPVRVSEGNTVACRGKRGVSDAMASALWAPDALFRLAAAGAAGLNLHSSDSIYDPFVLRRDRQGWSARVRPLYYGLLAFERTLGPGARLVGVSGRRPSALRAWATRDVRGVTRLLLIDTDPSRPARVRVPVAAGGARLELLTWAPGSPAPTLGGRSFGTRSRDARLHGRRRVVALPARGGRVTIAIPPASVALVTLPAAP